MTVVLLRFEAPMMSFGAARIDAYDRAGAIPTASMITGLFGAALGISRRHADTLQAMQDAIHVAVAVERRGEILEDYQNADLGKPHMVGPMWTVEGKPMRRAGSAVEDNRQQWRQYIVNGAVLAAVSISNSFPFHLTDLQEMMQEPAHPLCIGRVNCPPSCMIWQGATNQADMHKALSEASQTAEQHYLPATHYQPTLGDMLITLTGRKNWRTDRHVGAQTYIVKAA